jgi:dolichol-phosphate mannosyltransferase
MPKPNSPTDRFSPLQDSYPEISVVIPLYNESGNIEVLLRRLIPVVNSLQTKTEIILVNDGSTDSTWEEIQSANKKFENICGLSLSRNFGHQHALMAGLSFARGMAIISLDGDLQHPPEVIPLLVSAWREGNRIVDTRREDAKVASFFKRQTSKWFYKIFSLLSGVMLSPGSSDFRLIDRQVRDELLLFKDADLFLRGMVEWLGFSRTVIGYEAGPRFSGQSKYTLKRMLRFASGAVISFSVIPLRLGIWLGLLTAVASGMELCYILVQYMLGRTVPGWASTLGVLSMLFGVLFVVIGILGQYVARIHRMLQARPCFVVEKTIDGFK